MNLNLRQSVAEREGKKYEGFQLGLSAIHEAKFCYRRKYLPFKIEKEDAKVVEIEDGVYRVVV